MKKFEFKKLDKKGFTLTEVMIGMTILTVAIVASTNLLISFISSNKLIVENTQAYFLAQEGLEAMRNIRDSNWLNKVNFKGPDSTQNQGNNNFYLNIENGKFYSLFLDENFINGNLNSKPWMLEAVGDDDISKDNTLICINNTENPRFTSCAAGYDKTKFHRYIEITKSKQCEGALPEDDLCNKDSFLARSYVKWDKGEIILEEVMTNWKD
ncbi:MAG: type II secretion system protein [Candidatus Gracilibacteria bacterium]|jgi:prepilin-type N-terminal cleavage/methylation domain-containing protein